MSRGYENIEVSINFVQYVEIKLAASFLGHSQDVLGLGNRKREGGRGLPADVEP